MATTFEAVLELRDAAGAPVWASRTLHEIRVRDTELAGLTGRYTASRSRSRSAGADRVGRLGPGRSSTSR